MIFRNVAVRHGRALAPPVSRSTLRQLSTEATKTDNAASETPSSELNDVHRLPKIIPGVRKREKYLKTHVYSLTADTAHEHRGLSWAKPHKVNASSPELSPTEQYKQFNRVQTNTKKLGTQIKDRYVPSALLSNPPRPEDITLELLMASQTHIGHHKSLWNPANSRNIYGQRDSTHIISLEVTAAHLRRAARVVEETACNGGLIVFVGTRRGQMEIVIRAAELAGGYHVFTRWVAGTITNRDMILANKMAKVVDIHDKEQTGFQEYLQDARPLTPDLVVCLNPMENHALLHECGLEKIPTIGIVDTDCEPSWLTYGIPANDDSHRSVGLIAGVLGRAGQAGQARRRKTASTGGQTWQQPWDLDRHIKESAQVAHASRDEALKKLRANVMGFTDEEKALLQSQFPYKELEMTEDSMLELLGQSVGSTEKKSFNQQRQNKKGGKVEASPKQYKAEAAKEQVTEGKEPASSQSTEEVKKGE